MARYVVALVLLVGVLALVGAGCGGGDEGASAPPETTTETTEGGATGDAANGEQVFASAGCGGCHTTD